MPRDFEWDIPTRVITDDYTVGTIDPLTAAHLEALGSLQDKYDETQKTIDKTSQQFKAEAKTLSGNLENLHQLRSPAINLIENKLNLFIIAIIFYYLFKG